MSGELFKIDPLQPILKRIQFTGYPNKVIFFFFINILY